MEQPLVDRSYTLEKFPGKGGWTYARIPEVDPDYSSPFGWMRVRGQIDGYAFKQLKLAPFGDGGLFFPVKAAIRKAIGKEAGDTVRIILYRDDSPLEVPQEFLDCLQEERGATEAFLALRESRQKEFLDWIYSAKRVETRADRIAVVIGKMLRGSL